MSSPPKLDSKLIAQTLNYHGQQLQKVWESERGEDDLAKLGVPPLNFATFQARQKYLSFQDRGKRLILHQFIAKEAPALFDAGQVSEDPSSTTAEAGQADDNICAVMPPLEVFLNVDANTRQRHFFQNIKAGELVIGTVINRNSSGMMLKVLFSMGPCPRYVADINVKAFLSLTNSIPAFDSKKNVSRNYLMNDTVCCEVLEVIPDTDKISVGMKGITRGSEDPPPKPALGLITAEDLPLVYRKTMDLKNESYESLLEKSPGFNNPNCISYLSDSLGLSSTHCMNNLLSLRGGFPPNEYVDELKQAQASRWAFKFVAEGIEHFKAGRHAEAFQCLNEALKIDSRNVEGLVARGALYANSGAFKKAIDDFETSLQINPNHANARKYMGETLVALGRSYEDENKFKEAQEAYESCLNIIPFHEEAQSSLEFLKSKSNKSLIEPAGLLLPGLSGSKQFEVKETLKQLLNLTEKKEKKSKKKKRGKGKKKHHRSSSSSSSSSDSSSSSSSSDSSSSSSDSSDTEGGRRKKKRRSRSRNKKQKSLSPLSKRMAMIEPSMDKSHNSQFNHPFGWQPVQESISAAPALTRQDFDYELKVRKFLEISKEDSDYEEKVRNLLSEGDKYKRDRKMQELASQEHEKSSKARKKAKKDSKKSKKESKKKRKEREREERRKAKLARASNAGGDYLDFDPNMSEKKLRDALRADLKEEKKRKRDRNSVTPDASEFEKKHDDKRYHLEGISDMDELESKLNAYYAKVEKDTGRSAMRQDNGRPDGKSYDRSRSASLDKPPKWKMQMNASKDRSRKSDGGYDEDLNRSYGFRQNSEDDRDDRNLPSPDDKNISVRRAMALKEPPPLPPPKPMPVEPPPPPEEPPRPKHNVVLDKFGNFRLAKEGEGDPNGPQNRGRRDSRGRHSRTRSRTPDDPRKRSSRSRSRPRKYRSRSRSGSTRSSRSISRGRPRRSRSVTSRTPRSGSRSGGSRSRSRSGSRSRSRSGDRRMRRGGWRGRGGYDRGTYYKPRFQPYGSRGNNNRGRDFRRDDRRYDWRDRGGRGRPYRPRIRGGNRGRPFRGGYRDFRDRRQRYSRSRSPDRSRRSRSFTPDENAPRRHQEKERGDRFSDREAPRSEGEYEEERYVDRKEYDGKWADNGEPGSGGGGAEDKGADAPAPKDEE